MAASLGLSMRREELTAQPTTKPKRRKSVSIQLPRTASVLFCSTVCREGGTFKFRLRNALLCLKFKLYSPVSGPRHVLTPTLSLVCVSQLKRLKCFLTTKTGTKTTTRAHAMINLLYPICYCWLPFAVPLSPLTHPLSS